MTQTKDSATKVASRPTTVPNSRPTTVASRTTTVASHGTTVPNPRPTTVASRATTAASQATKVPNPRATTVPDSQVDHVNDDINDRMSQTRNVHFVRITFVNTGTIKLYLKLTQNDMKYKPVAIASNKKVTYKLQPQVKFNYVVTHFAHKIKHTDDDATIRVSGETTIEVSASNPN